MDFVAVDVDLFSVLVAVLLPTQHQDLFLADCEGAVLHMRKLMFHRLPIHLFLGPEDPYGCA